MFSSNAIKIFLVFALLSCQACGFCQPKIDSNISPAPPFVEELKSEIPFSTKEPDAFQAEIVVIAADNSEDKTFIAKNGANLFTTFDFQGKAEFAVLKIGGSESFLIAPNQKIYAENDSENSGVKSESLNDLLTAGWSNPKASAKFERLGAENNAENNVVKYRVILGEATASEIIMLIDERIGLPVRQEFYSIGSEQKTLTLTVELKNFSAPAEARFFEVPADYKKVSTKEFRETLRRMRAK